MLRENLQEFSIGHMLNQNLKNIGKCCTLFEIKRIKKIVMKIEWGKKVCCPACSLAFYDMGKHSLVCPYCQYAFDADALLSKGIESEPEEIEIEEGAIEMPGFEFENEVVPDDIQDNDIDEDINNFKLQDME